VIKGIILPSTVIINRQCAVNVEGVAQRSNIIRLAVAAGTNARTLAETLRAVDSIAADADFASGYAYFQRNMVYGQTADFALKTGQA
jgi:hypothetical protein